MWANSLEFSRNRLKLSADKMYRACELKDQTYKKTRTLHFPDKRHNSFTARLWEWGAQLSVTVFLKPQFRCPCGRVCLATPVLLSSGPQKGAGGKGPRQEGATSKKSKSVKFKN